MSQATPRVYTYMRYNEIQYHAICRFEKPQAFWAATRAVIKPTDIQEPQLQKKKTLTTRRR